MLSLCNNEQLYIITDRLASTSYKQGVNMNDKQREALEQAYAEEQAKLPPMPERIGFRAGCKVSWYEFATLADAEIASLWAKLQAEYYSYFGYDYGYFCGGEISQTGDGTYTVVFP